MGWQRVTVDITEARHFAREAIAVDGGLALNPGEARRLADDIRAAADVVDQLTPPAALPLGKES